MSQQAPSYPSWQDEVLIRNWTAGEQYHVHTVGIWASSVLPDGLHRAVEADNEKGTVRFEDCPHTFAFGHVRLYPANWRELELARQEEWANAPIFIPLSAIRVREQLEKEKNNGICAYSGTSDAVSTVSL